MTQPERPDRVDIPESNSSTSHEAVEPVDLGQRRRRRDFVPEKPSSVSPNVLTPADRSSARTIQEQIDAIAARQPYEEVEEDKSSEFLGEPTIPEEKKDFPIKRTIAGGLGIIALTAAGFLGLNKINSEDNGSERPGVIITDSTLEPTTPPPTFTPESIPTPETTPTKEPEKSPYEFSVMKTIGNVTLSIENKLTTRTKCPDPTMPKNSASLVDCSPMTDVVIHNDEYPDLEKDMEKTKQKAFYYAWINQEDGRKDISFEEYQEKLKEGVDLSFKTWGFEGNSFLPGEIIINPTDDLHIDWLAEPTVTFKPFTSFGIGYRKINNELHIELWNYLPPSGENFETAKGNPTSNIFAALTYLSNFEMLKKGFGSQQDIRSTISINEDLASKFYRQRSDGTYSLAITLE